MIKLRQDVTRRTNSLFQVSQKGRTTVVGNDGGWGVR